MADVKWIKIVTDVFDDEKMLLIDGLPEHDGIIVIWFKLLCMAGKQNNGGVFMLNDKIAYNDEMLATIFRRPISTVRLALETFEQFGMIEIINNAITIPNWEKHQSLDKIEAAKEKTRQRVARHREKQKLLAERNVTGNGDVTQSNADRLEEDKDKDKDLDKEKEKKNIRHKYGEYSNVLLSDDDMEKLRAEFPLDYEERIERLSSYIASSGKSYKNHLATIRNWARKEAKDTKQGTFETDDFYHDALKKALGDDLYNELSDLNKPKPKTAGEDASIRERAEKLKRELA